MLLLPRVEPQLLLGVPACRLVTTHSTIPNAVLITYTIATAEYSKTEMSWSNFVEAQAGVPEGMSQV